MVFDPEIHHRRSIRLKGYDYSQDGAYFVTVCVKDRDHLLGSVRDDIVILSGNGKSVLDKLKESIIIRKEINIDSFVIMPNHIHLIILISNVGANGNLPEIDNKDRVNCHSPLQMRPRSLSSFMVGFKSSVTRQIGFSIWQRGFYDRIIRNDNELKFDRYYIKTNPENWEKDEYFV